ncbi:MAG: hypothetical protein Q9183_000431 [Haloplaca sp. 2 TL-2023]
MSASADDQYEQQNDVTGGDVPSGTKLDNDYASRSGQYQVPVQKDEAPDDADAIDKSNIVGGRTRGAAPTGGYSEPGDEEGLPGADDGTSRGASSS